MALCRSNYGDYFGITVAGYPEAHPEVISDDPKAMEEAYQSDLQYLKKKVGWSSVRSHVVDCWQCCICCKSSALREQQRCGAGEGLSGSFVQSPGPISTSTLLPCFCVSLNCQLGRWLVFATAVFRVPEEKGIVAVHEILQQEQH